MEDPTASLASMIRTSLEASGMSQSALATAIASTDSTISRLLNGRTADVTVLVRVADYFRWSQDRRREALDYFARARAVADGAAVPPEQS